MELEILYLVIIKKGPAWTADDSSELDQLQAAHLAHIDTMRAEGHLIVAGPIDDGSDLRGISVLRADSLEKAIALSEEDPSIRAGRLQVEVHPWYVPTCIFS